MSASLGWADAVWLARRRTPNDRLRFWGSMLSSAIAAASGQRGDAAHDTMQREVMDLLRGQFRPEFLNRVDEVIVFHALTDDDLGAIVDLLLADLGRRLAQQDLALDLTPAARALIVREGTDPAFGARPLKRTIQRLVENPLARALVSGEFRRHAEALHAAIRERWTSPVPLETRIGRGAGWQEALDDVGWEETELLVIGSSVYGPLLKVFIGSNSGRLVRLAPVPRVVLPRWIA